ncbi:hypothetical protein FQR65_LT02564 [Abscondita terminalis]|nr:hypothetical protein FQR65_LT02564 [Abscondita terminalis]
MYPSGDSNDPGYSKTMLIFIVVGVIVLVTLLIMSIYLIAQPIKCQTKKETIIYIKKQLQAKALEISKTCRGIPITYFPSAVAIIDMKSNIHVCNGVAVSDRWVLTVAHCLTSCVEFLCMNYGIRAGSTFSNRDGKVYKITKIVIHPLYNSSTIENDLVLIKIDRMNNEGEIYITNVTQSSGQVYGWETFSLADSGYRNNILKTNELDIVPNDLCNMNIKGERTNFIFRKNMICTMSRTKQSGCRIDPGSPLVSTNRLLEEKPRTCGSCPGGQQQNADKTTEYLQTNTVPKPELAYQQRSALNETHLGVSSNSNPPDLKASLSKKPGASDKGDHGSSCEECCHKDRNKEKEPCPESQYSLGKCDDKKPNKGILKQVEKRTSEKILQPEPLNKDQTEAPTCYLPQPNDNIPNQKQEEMGPIGPWATGRVDWSPIAGMTGTRPIVDKYSITRYSEGEWRRHNEEIINKAKNGQQSANLLEWNGARCLEQSSSDNDKNQEDSTKRLYQRVQLVHKWKCELEMSIAAASEEITYLEEQRVRLKSAGAVLTLPESICGECIERRTGRLDPDLVRDEVEEELIKEMALISEIRETFARTLKDVELQLLEDKTAKQRLEYDWCDKTIAHELESVNCALNNKSTILMFKPGSTIFPEEQSSEAHWENFTRETLQEGEATRQRSLTLRGTLDAILMNASKDLRAQANRVDTALSKNIACNEQLRITLENELLKILQRLANIENLIDKTRDAIRRQDVTIKTAQTRLDNRLLRPRVENCRDEAHYGLIEEVKNIGENVAGLSAQLKSAERAQAELIQARMDLEREIMIKRKTLEIDRTRIQTLRSHYPSATALAGH